MRLNAILRIMLAIIMVGAGISRRRQQIACQDVVLPSLAELAYYQKNSHNAGDPLLLIAFTAECIEKLKPELQALATEHVRVLLVTNDDYLSVKDILNCEESWDVAFDQGKIISAAMLAANCNRIPWVWVFDSNGNTLFSGKIRQCRKYLLNMR